MALVHARRPGSSTVATKCRVRANHFLVQVAENNLYHYDDGKDEHGAEYLSQLHKYGFNSVKGKMTMILVRSLDFKDNKAVSGDRETVYAAV